MTTRVGELSVTPLSDGELWTAPDGLLNKAAEAWPPGYLNGDGLMGVNFGGFLVRTPSAIVVVDTGIGSGAIPELPIGSFPQRLADAGVAPEDVDVVIFTHLHFDHVGCRRMGAAGCSAAPRTTHTRSIGRTTTGPTHTPKPGRDETTSARSRLRSDSRRSRHDRPARG